MAKITFNQENIVKGWRLFISEREKNGDVFAKLYYNINLPRKAKHRQWDPTIVFPVSDREMRDDVASLQDDLKRFYKDYFGMYCAVAIQSDYMRRECPSAWVEY